MALSGYMAVSLGWESIFYIFGCSSLVIGALWFILTSNSPDVHPWISDRERRYILDAIGVSMKFSDCVSRSDLTLTLNGNNDL